MYSNEDYVEHEGAGRALGPVRVLEISFIGLTSMTVNSIVIRIEEMAGTGAGRDSCRKGAVLKRHDFPLFCIFEIYPFGILIVLRYFYPAI